MTDGAPPFAAPHDLRNPRASDSFTAWRIEHDSDGLRRLRRFTHDTLTGWGLAAHADDIATVAGELFSHARPHPVPTAPSHPSTWLALTHAHSTLTCTLHDPCPHPPPLTALNRKPEAQWGLRLIHHLTATWGWSTPDPTGKTLWAAIPVPVTAKRSPAPPRL